MPSEAILAFGPTDRARLFFASTERTVGGLMSRMPGTIALFLRGRRILLAGPGQESMKARGEGSERHPDESTTPGSKRRPNELSPRIEGQGHDRYFGMNLLSPQELAVLGHGRKERIQWVAPHARVSPFKNRTSVRNPIS